MKQVTQSQERALAKLQESEDKPEFVELTGAGYLSVRRASSRWTLISRRGKYMTVEEALR